MRGAEDMHLELARRIALAVGGGTVDAVVYTKLSRMSGDQLWIESKFWDGLEGDWDEHCSICVIRPAFVGDSFAR